MGKASRTKKERRMVGPYCDFCGLPPAFIFPTRKFSMVFRGIDLGKDDGIWNACQRCSDYVEAREWDSLFNRCYDFMVRRYNLKAGVEVSMYILQLHQAFDANRIGPKREWSETP